MVQYLFVRNALLIFTKYELLQKHITYCSSNETVYLNMPSRNTMLCFNNYHKQFPIPFVVYADFKCFTKPINTCRPKPDYSYNYNCQKHEPSGFCFYIKGIVPDITFEPILYTKTKSTDDIAVIFVSKLAKVTNKIYNDFYRRPIPLKLTHAEQMSFDKAEICHICKKELLILIKLEIIVILLVNTVELLITVAIYSVKNH